MQKVEMIVSGNPALVDQDMVKKIIQKRMLVDRGMNLQQMIKTETDPTAKSILQSDAAENASKIIRLNRTIRSGCVQFI